MLADVTMEHYDATMDVDLRGVLLGMKHGIRAMLEHGDGGAIINWSSIGGLNALAVHERVLGGEGGRDRGDQGRGGRVRRATASASTRSAPASSTPRSWARTRSGPRACSRRRRCNAAGSPGGGRGRGVPRVGPRVVRHAARSSPSTAAGPRSSRERHRRLRLRQPAPPGTSGPRVQSRSRTRGCSPAAAPTSTTSRCPGCCTRASCAARSPAAAIRGIDTVGRARRCPACASCSPPPTSTPASRSSGTRRSGPQSPETPRPPLAEGEVRFVGDPVALVVAESRCARRGRGRAGRRRLRAAARRSSTTPRPRTPTRSCTSATAPTSSARWPACPLAALDDVFARGRPRGDARRSTSRRTPPVPMEGRGLVVDYSRGDRRAHDLRGDAVAARGAALLLPPARACPSTASAS